MSYRIWKLRTGRRASIPQTIDISIILLSGAVGSFVALALLLTYFLYSCSVKFYADNPKPVNFKVGENLVTVAGDSRQNQDDDSWRRNAATKEEPTDPCWISSWNEGISIAARKGLPVLVDFRSNYGYWCDRMDNETLSSPEIRKRLDNGWVCIRIDIGRPDKTGTFGDNFMTYRGMANAFHIEGIPTSLFIDSSGKPVQTVPGFLPKETFGALLDYMKDRVYERKIPFEKYRASLASMKR